MQIGTVKIDGRLVLAPMAGVTDLAFRRICREMGAALVYSEMVSAKGLWYKDKKLPEPFHHQTNPMRSDILYFQL